ncbi:MAG: glycoside hydrolase family 3 N-terminal domain-containing protein [Bacteroidota bacterium]
MNRTKLSAVCAIAVIFMSSLLRSQPSLEQKIAQMIMVGFSGTTVPESLKTDLTARGLGGVILFAANIADPQQVKTLTAQLQNHSGGSLLIAVDQEGGRVARLSANNGFAATPSAYKLGTLINNEDTTRAAAAMMASWLQQSGFTINFAPVADVRVNPLSPAIGKLDRSFSADPDTVSRHIEWFIDEFHKKKIVTTLKHFPGHGSAATDSHLGFTDVTATWSADELIPFRYAIDNGFADLIMTGHLYNKTIDTLYPGSLSNATVTGLLRDSLGYDGVVISDELFMNAISANYEFDDALELCVTSGTDILLFNKSIYNNNSLTAYVINSIAGKVRGGTIAESLIDSAYDRIQRLKQSITTGTLFADVPVPNETALYPNYPNPFNGSTTIRYTIRTAGNATIMLYDLLGRNVATIVNEYHQPGSYAARIQIGGGAIPSLPSGVYFYRLQSGTLSETGRMIYLR